jgi:hypothetical protein
MQMEPGEQLLGVRVVDIGGNRLGRLAAAYCTPDPLVAVWLILRLTGVRRRWRAVPAQQARWTDATQTILRVGYPRSQVLSSPAVDENSLDTAAGRVPLEHFYQPPAS